MCQDCLNKCITITPDGCVLYSGADVPELGLCQGDTTLLQLETILISQVLSLATGAGITLDVTSSCNMLTTLIGTDKTLSSLMQAYADAICALNESITDVEATVNQTYSINTSCLTDLPASPTLADIVQAVVSKLCSLSLDVEIIKQNYVTTASVTSIVQTYINSQASTGQEYLKMNKFVAVPYHGPLNVFDGTGKGIAAYGYDKVYVCNGQTVTLAGGGFYKTPDYRGYSPIGANTGVPATAALDAAIDPSVLANQGYAMTLGDKKGTYTHKLTVQQMPTHGHVVTDPGHKHRFQGLAKRTSDDGNNLIGYESGTHGKDTETAKTNISIEDAGGSASHNNLQPSLATVFIMYVPS